MPETKPVSVKATAVDKALTEALRSNGVPKEALASAVALVRDLSSKGLKPTGGFPMGTPRPELVTIETHATADQLGAILGFATRKQMRGIKILINGIPDPDIYRVQFELGVPQQ